MRKVSLKGLEVYGYHGCLEEEAIIGTWFVVDIDVYYNFKEAALSDELSKTIDYVILSEIAVEEIGIRSKLIEQVAERIHKRIKIRYAMAERIKVCLYKKNPPAGVVLQHVSVTIDE